MSTQWRENGGGGMVDGIAGGVVGSIAGGVVGSIAGGIVGNLVVDLVVDVVGDGSIGGPGFSGVAVLIGVLGGVMVGLLVATFVTFVGVVGGVAIGSVRRRLRSWRAPSCLSSTPAPGPHAQSWPGREQPVERERRHRRRGWRLRSRLGWLH
jgi:hypothetical protein